MRSETRRAEDISESRGRGFSGLWPVAPDYRIEDDRVCPLVNGKIVSPTLRTGMREIYPPMARPTLPGELAKVSTEGDVLTFVREYGLLGYMHAWRGLEKLGIDSFYGGQVDLVEEPEPTRGDPVGWVLSHARTVELVLALSDSLDNDRAVRVQVERLTVGLRQSDGTISEETIRYTVATRGHPVAMLTVVPKMPPREAALQIIASILSENLTGLSRRIYIEHQDHGQQGFTSGFFFHNLLDCIYWHLADAVTKGQVRRCANPECGTLFVATNKKMKYCPPALRSVSVSSCMNRHKQQEYRDREKEKQ